MAQTDPATADLDRAYAHCADLIRSHDRDRFLASLFAPGTARRRLCALYAFNLEIARVREVVREPLPGEVRLQWWRDLIEGLGRGDVSGHPVASALMDLLATSDLPRAALLNLIEARIFDLYDDPMPRVNDLEGYAGETASVLIQLAAGLLVGRMDAALATVAGHAGVAVALTGLMRALPLHAARGQCYLPVDLLSEHEATPADVVAGKATPGVLAALAALRKRVADHLAAAGAAAADIPAAAVPAFLPVALVPRDLQALARASDPFARVVGDAPVIRQWTLWRAARRAQAGKAWIRPWTMPRGG
ncbi:phytoene/squalene synthase family protein [Aquabacter spiritensis]|uniref:Phytoene synthase n=1 Tax=Aquabacter spiritensis TaxID=933073 RepID=A0A4R3LVD7_9HYPH|nr:phytoene/squalene synthase family protein [Aquabacter spiritensis]TCT04590.1 phytoene synthase [Aquabacter spiritensis]